MNEGGAQVIEEFFPESIRSALIEQVETSELRKQEFRLGQTRAQVPRSIAKAAAVASARLGLEFNFAILKSYRLSDEYKSQAYLVHRDPERLASIPLVLCSLKGEADLIYWENSGIERRIRCRPNMVVLLDPKLAHQVTPPTGPEGERFLLFLGFDTSYPEVRVMGNSGVGADD
jgi:hypothetical protein